MFLEKEVKISLDSDEIKLWDYFESMLDFISKELNGDEDGEKIELLCDTILTHMYDLAKFINKG